MMMSPADPNKMMMPPMDNCQMLENQIMNLEKRVTRLEGMMEGKTLNHAESNNFYMV